MAPKPPPPPDPLLVLPNYFCKNQYLISEGYLTTQNFDKILLLEPRAQFRVNALYLCEKKPSLTLFTSLTKSLHLTKRGKSIFVLECLKLCNLSKQECEMVDRSTRNVSLHCSGCVSLVVLLVKRF